MADTNPTRNSRKEQRISQLQFSHSIGRMNFRQLYPRMFDTSFLFNYFVILTGHQELKDVFFQKQANIKYPLAMIVFGLHRFFKDLEITTPKFEGTGELNHILALNLS